MQTYFWQNPKVGLLDTGVDADLATLMTSARRFASDTQGYLIDRPVLPDPTGHGSALARIILAKAPNARLCNAQVFTKPGVTSAAAIAAGLDWLAAENVALVNVSLGIRRDRAILREACARAMENGCILVAAAPARGPAVYPSSYPGALRISSDARCAPEDISHLKTMQAEFGACPRSGDQNTSDSTAGGASFAVAHVTGLLADYLARGGDRLGCRQYLQDVAVHHGPERRSADLANYLPGFFSRWW
ncbi:MAG: subtilisin-like serine protease QhpE [Gammaproteobacteria bacterium]